MKFNYSKSLATLLFAAGFAMSANAETIEVEQTIDFTQMEVGTKFNTFWGGPNDGMAIVSTDEGNLLYVCGHEPNVNDLGFEYWSTKCRIPGYSLGSYKLSDVTMIIAEYKTTQDDGVKFGMQLRNPDSDYIVAEHAPIVGEWCQAIFTGSDFVQGGEPLASSPSIFDLCFGIEGSTNYYIKSITFYMEKEVSQREKDEMELDKSTAACFVFNFDEWPVSTIIDEKAADSPYIGSNGGSVNRSDMIIDKGPEDYNNNCAHIIYGGWTNIFVTQPVKCPEGYVFDDIRLIEYDIYVTDLSGIDCTNGNASNGNENPPMLKIKDGFPWGWEPVGGQGTPCPAGKVKELNTWTHVEFVPSAFNYVARTFDQNVVDENGDVVYEGEGDDRKPVTESVTWDAATVAKEFAKKTSFYMSIGFMPCLNQSYVDNVKVWFQKSKAAGEDPDAGVDNVAVDSKDAPVEYYNLQGVRVANPANGLYIKRQGNKATKVIM